MGGGRGKESSNPYPRGIRIRTTSHFRNLAIKKDEMFKVLKETSNEKPVASEMILQNTLQSKENRRG